MGVKFSFSCVHIFIAFHTQIKKHVFFCFLLFHKEGNPQANINTDLNFKYLYDTYINSPWRSADKFQMLAC